MNSAQRLMREDRESGDGIMIEELYNEINNARHLPVLVEGPKDKRSLEKLGFRDVRHLRGPLYSIVEQIEHEEEVIVLTDLDAHGRGLYKYFYAELTRRGVRVNNRLRIKLFSTPVRQIEGLASFLRRAEMADD